MLSKEERIRALIGNLKNIDWSVTTQFRLEREDGAALIEYFRDKDIMMGVFPGKALKE